MSPFGIARCAEKAGSNWQGGAGGGREGVDGVGCEEGCYLLPLPLPPPPLRTPPSHSEKIRKMTWKFRVYSWEGDEICQIYSEIGVDPILSQFYITVHVHVQYRYIIFISKYVQIIWICKK